MPCDTVRYGQRVRNEAINKLTDRLNQAQTTITKVDQITGEVSFLAETRDGLVFSGTLQPNGDITNVSIEGWSLEQRAGWCDGCSLEYLKGSSTLDRIREQVRSQESGFSLYERDALKIGR